MTPCSFVLAVPTDWNGTGAIERVARTNEVCRDRPSVWLGATTHAIRLGADGLVIGPLFRRGGTQPLDTLGDAFETDCSPITTAGRLVREYWGGYFATGLDPDRGGIWALSEPSGLLPVYRATTRTHTLLATEVGLLVDAGLTWPAIAWAALADHLRYPELRQAQTCLTGVHQLAPGYLVRTARDAGSPLPIWRPDTFMPRSPLPDFAEGVAALRSCAVETIGAWAGLNGPVAVAASGGVDSSFICAALAHAKQPFGCVTLATADPSGDESTFVTALGQHLGVEVVTAAYDAGLVDITRPASSGLPRPNRRTFLQALDVALDQARSQLGATTVFDGNGGDNLFCYLHSAAPVVDCLSIRGPWPAFSTMLDMCAVTGCDLAAMGRATWRRYKRGASRKPWAADLRLLAADLQSAGTVEPLTPWLCAQVGAHRGKIDHLALILQAQNHIHGLGGTGTPRFSPLMSQPLLELCLTLPTWLWCQGGINRAIARAAFASDLPPSILRRTSKAGPDSMIRQIFARNRGEVRDLLLGGSLAAEGVLDRHAVAAAMATDTLSKDAIVYRLLDLVEAENWVRSWLR